MAQKALKKLEERLDCSVCLDTYTDPKQLQCFHIFCQRCLARLVTRDQQGRFLPVVCPTCRQPTPVPAGSGVAGLQSAFHVNHLLEIRGFLKELKIASSYKRETAASDGGAGKTVVPLCPTHTNKELELYCGTCEEMICAHCAIRGGAHHAHDYALLDEAFKLFHAELSRSLEPLESQLERVRDALRELDKRRGEVDDQERMVEGAIDDVMTQLYQILDARKSELVSQLRRTARRKRDTLALQKDQIETTQAQLSGCLESIQESLKTDNSQREVLMRKTTIVKQVKELTTTFQPDLLKPHTEADMVLSTSTGLPLKMAALCSDYGQVLALGVLDPSKCYATGMGVELGRVGEASFALVHAVSFGGQSCEEEEEWEEGEAEFECTMTSDVTGAPVKDMVVRQVGRGQHQISYTPLIKGRHQLCITVEGQHIRGSPFGVAVMSSVEKLGTPILTIDGLENPMGVAICGGGVAIGGESEQEQVLVTEMGVDQVLVFTPGGERVRTIGSCGSGDGQFRSPHGVAVGHAHCILVTDYSNHRIQMFSREGEFVNSVGTSGRGGPLEFNCPTGIACGPEACGSKIYVTDENHRVQILNSDLTYSGTFGREGSGRGQFCYPSDVTCDLSGRVYVADSYNHRIQIFTPEGLFLGSFGRRGEGGAGDKLSFPASVAVDADGLIYVSDCNNHKVCVFSSEGVFVRSFGGKGKRVGELRGPHGIAVDRSGVVYVCDTTNQRIQAF